MAATDRQSSQRVSAAQREIVVDSEASEHVNNTIKVLRVWRSICDMSTKLASRAKVTTSGRGSVEVRTGGRPVILNAV